MIFCAGITVRRTALYVSNRFIKHERIKRIKAKTMWAIEGTAMPSLSLRFLRPFPVGPLNAGKHEHKALYGRYKRDTLFRRCLLVRYPWRISNFCRGLPESCRLLPETRWILKPRGDRIEPPCGKSLHQATSGSLKTFGSDSELSRFCHREHACTPSLWQSSQPPFQWSREQVFVLSFFSCD